MLWIDISHHQGKIDFDKVASAGVTGVIVKATEGRDHVDPRWRENWAALREHPELERSAYHMARFDTDRDDPSDARVEAAHFVRELEAAGYEDAVVPWVDVERYGLTGDDHYNVDWLIQHVDAIETLLGRTPGTYTGRGVWAERLADTPLFSHVPLWAVDLKREPGKARVFGGWTSVAVHQHNHRGRVPGIRGDVDLNEVDEDVAVLLRRSGIIVPKVCERPRIDLRGFPPDEVRAEVKLLQGALLGAGLGPEGLVGLDGLPDGKAGSYTRKHLNTARARIGLPASSICDGAVWSFLGQVRRLG